jgi:hypothetical protein
MAFMDLRPYIDEIHRQLESAAETGGEDARVLAEKLVAPLDAAVRLSLLDAVTAAAQEITCELAPGSVEVRLRGRNVEFVVTTPTEPEGGPASESEPPVDWSAPGVAVGLTVGDERGVSRINVRMPEHLKVRVDHAAAEEGLSVNTWLVRAAAAAVERADPARRIDKRGQGGSNRFTGWSR